MMTPETIKIIIDEVERRWRERTPVKNVLDACPESRVIRSEMLLFAEQNGIKIELLDDDYDRAMFQLFDRLRKEFPDEKWEPRKNWTAGTKSRRKELGLK